MDTSRLWRILLLVVSGFNALSAVVGGIGLMTPWSLGMPTWWIEDSVFTYVSVGLILLVVAGGRRAWHSFCCCCVVPTLCSRTRLRGSAW